MVIHPGDYGRTPSTLSVPGVFHRENAMAGGAGCTPVSVLCFHAGIHLEQRPVLDPMGGAFTGLASLWAHTSEEHVTELVGDFLQCSLARVEP